MTGRTALTALTGSFATHSETPVPLSSCSAAAFSRCYDRCADTLVFGRTQNVTNRNPVQHVYLDDDVAFVMAVMLVSIATVCPAIACPLGQVSGTQSRSCCHQPQPQPTSCPRTTIQSCPYLSLEKSTAATTTPDAVSVSLTPVSPELPVLNRLSPFGIEDRLPNSAGLFLRIRVLLI